jgi:hypothetical protein
MGWGWAWDSGWIDPSMTVDVGTNA